MTMNKETCYFQGCSNAAINREHIPPKGFFPKNQRDQLITVPSCEKHNNKKTTDDTYILAHICMYSSPNNQSREVFIKHVAKQLDYNNSTFRKMIAKNSISFSDKVVAYPVNIKRFDDFFTALSCGVIYSISKKSLPNDYSIKHIYCNFINEEHLGFSKVADEFYSKTQASELNFGKLDTWNKSIYSAKIFGVPDFKSSITIIHEFFEKFRVMSFLTKKQN